MNRLERIRNQRGGSSQKFLSDNSIILNKSLKYREVMSLQDNKNALFGKAPMSSIPPPQRSTPASSATQKSSGSTVPKASGVSPELKARKITEAREAEERAQKALKTSVRDG